MPIDAKRGEDGSGRSRSADDPHALVLHVGRLHFHDYVHTDRNTLRFVVDDVSRLPVGEAVYVQYGEDARSRIRLGDLEQTW